jgi:glycosyltransferase involved in cell wall biosynthesis
MPETSLSVVVPCYNEQEVVREFHRRTTVVCAGLGIRHEIVLINDGSKDKTWEIICELVRTDSRVVGLNLSRNHGHQLALTAGLSICRYDRILIIDADLQDPPELLPQMMKLMDDGVDVVYGQRQKRAAETWFKRASAAMFYRLIDKLTDTRIPRDTGDFRLITRRVLLVLASMPERHRFIRGLIGWIGFRQEPIFYNRDARLAGETKYPLRKMVRFALDAITSFSTKPLMLASYLGFAFSAFAFALLIYTFISWLLFKAVSGWSSMMAGMSLLGGIQLLVLGIFGEYLGRLVEQSKGRPLYIIDNVVRNEDADTASASPAPFPQEPAAITAETNQ